MDSNNNQKSGSDRASTHRRRFITTAVTAGTASLIPGAAQTAQSAPQTLRRKLRIGALAVGEFSFWPYSWGDILSQKEPLNGATLGADVLAMEITHVWDVNPEAAKSFAAKVGAEAVSHYDDMVGKVDGVAFGGYYEVPWQHRLARPYLEAGIPTCLSRPFAYSLRDIDEILDCAAKHSTPIMATDLYEHLFSVITLKNQLKNIGEIKCVFGTCLTTEYPALFHTQWMIQKIFGNDIGKVSVLTDNPLASTYLVGTYLYNGREGQPLFPCILTNAPGGDLYSFMVTGSGGIETSRLPQIPDRQADLLTHHLPMLVDMQRTFEGKNYEEFDVIRKKTEIFLTGFYSAIERNGAPVNVGTVPADWRAIPAKPGWIDESMFRR